MSVRSFTSAGGAVRSSGRSRRSALTVVVVALLALAGCGADGDGVLHAAGELRSTAASQSVQAAPTPAFLAQSAERTVAVDTGRIEASLTGPGVDVTVTGSFDVTNRSAALTVAATISGDAIGEPDDIANTADIVIVDDAVYVRPDGFAGVLGEAMGTPWVKADLGDLGSLAPGAVEIPAVDPDELVAELEREGVTVTEVGPEVVRGVATTHYRADVPADPATNRPAGVFDVWVDDAGLIRRIDAVSGDHVARIELIDLGAPVSITVPAPDQVTDLGDLSDLRALEGLLGELPR